MSTIHNFGHPEISANSHAYLRPLSSLSLPSNSGDSGFLPSRCGSATASTTNSHVGISSTSGNTSVGSSPIPTEQDIDQVLRKAVELLTLRNEALKHANASSKLTDTRYLKNVTGFYDFNVTNPIVNDSTAYEKLRDQEYAGMYFRQPTTNHLRPKRLPPCARKSLKPDSYKTVMCQAWLESGVCSFAENCRFAHGEGELRPCNNSPTKNPKYKTKLCDKYTMTGLCPYGDRCLFIHPELPNASNPYIRPDRYLKMQHERAFLASINSVNSVNSETPQISLSNRVTNRPPPSWPLESPAFFSAHRDLDQLLKLQYFTENVKPLSKKPEEILGGKNLDHTMVFNDITNQPMASVQATPNTVLSFSNSKVNTTTHDSPDSGISFHDYKGPAVRTNFTPQSDSLISSDYLFRFAIHADNLARSLACEFKID